MEPTSSSATIAGFLSGAMIALGLLGLAYPPLLTHFNERIKPRLWRRKPAERLAEIDGVPDHHVAVIAATVAAMTGAHRIVHIEPSHNGHTWQTQGRAAHHGSHTVFHAGASAHRHGNKGTRDHGTQIQNHGRRQAL